VGSQQAKSSSISLKQLTILFLKKENTLLNLAVKNLLLVELVVRVVRGARVDEVEVGGSRKRAEMWDGFEEDNIGL